MNNIDRAVRDLGSHSSRKVEAKNKMRWGDTIVQLSGVH